MCDAMTVADGRIHGTVMQLMMIFSTAAWTRMYRNRQLIDPFVDVEAHFVRCDLFDSTTTKFVVVDVDGNSVGLTFNNNSVHTSRTATATTTNVYKNCINDRQRYTQYSYTYWVSQIEANHF